MSASTIRVGNAPVSWGIYGPHDPHLPWERVMSAIAEAGYQGTELGPYGYYPTQPEVLRSALRSRRLGLGSSYVGVPLEDAARRQEAVDECVRVGSLLATQGVGEVIVADDDHPERMARAGRIPADGSLGWTDAQWREAAGTLHAIARALKDRFGMRVVVHHHVGTFIETPAELDRLLRETDPELVNLLLDTGHAVYGGGDPVELLRDHGQRIRYLHLKDVNRAELEQVRRSDVHVREAWKRGVFCPLGEGVVDFPRLAGQLRSSGYAGWAIVEQDVVPNQRGALDPDPFESARASRSYLKERVGL